MRRNFSPQFRTVTDFLILLLIFCFIGQSLIKMSGKEQLLLRMLGLSVDSVSTGYFWTLFSYSVLHEGPLHLVFNILGIHFISRNVENCVSREKYLFLLFISVSLGSAFWLTFNLGSGFLIGTSAFVLGSLTYFCLNRPNNHITFLLFFVLPISLKPKHLLLGVVGIEMYGFIFSELQNSSNIAHSAHLGGMTAGFLLSTSWINSINFPKFSFKLARSHPLSKKSIYRPYDYTINIEVSRDLEIQVDKILDKINEKGFGSLTDEEKGLLEKAKSLFNAKPK